jgi:RNA polymerase sigma-70 factor (ECF subfamily)
MESTVFINRWNPAFALLPRVRHRCAFDKVALPVAIPAALRHTGGVTMHSPHAPADEELLTQVAAGDRTAFATLYDRLAMPLYSLALKMLGSEAEAQDILQEVFLTVWNKASQFNAARGTAFSWMVTQLRNRAIDRIRSRRRRGELMETFGQDLEPGGESHSAAENAEASERSREVRAAMGKLSDEQQHVLRLAYFEGLTQSEIAEKLDEPLGTIKARAHRAMARLRDTLRFLRD